jgi:propanol-preferring alcohol dehydrogenase
LQLAKIVTISNTPSAKAPSIPRTQTAALVRELGGKVEFKPDYHVPKPGITEVLVKVLYTGSCQSDLHSKNGTAVSATGDPITKIKFPHVGGRERVGRVIALGPEAKGPIKTGLLVRIRFLNANIKKRQYMVVLGAGGGLGHFTLQYGLVLGAKVIAIDSGD